jgi:hypothetical protein
MMSDGGDSTGRNTGTTLLVVGLVLTILFIVLGVVLVVHTGLPSGAQCAANSDLVGC